MIRFEENFSLKGHNTFGIDAKARYFFEFTELEDLVVFLQSNATWKSERLIVLGEGSNILFMNDFEGLVIHPNIPGIQIIKEDRQHVWIEAGAGELWDEFVRTAVAWGYGGAENLSHIPGTVGAAPVQNIGAYGQEVFQVVEQVKGYDLEKSEAAVYSAEECRFTYRNSIFKQYLRHRFIITSVIFRMDKFPEFNLSYGRLEEEVKLKGEINLQNIRDAVIKIRGSKLPDTKELGSAGSFFKNPVVDTVIAEKLRADYEGMPVYEAGEGKVKLAAGWLIENAGWKGYRDGEAGVHEHQALVLVNYGGATGREIFNLSEKIRESVAEKFGAELEREVNCV